ncbi:hypothetical protein, partial [Escherichia coli]|uniref:hypothetical protein n=1 Tax=Escherichia coli TaxID=562 RepID=UPI00197DBC25
PDDTVNSIMQENSNNGTNTGKDVGSVRCVKEAAYGVQFLCYLEYNIRHYFRIKFSQGKTCCDGFAI